MFLPFSGVKDGCGEREKWIEKNKARDKYVAEGEQMKEREIIFKMFSAGLDDKMISDVAPGYSVEDIASLREEWQETNSSEKAD